MLAKNTKKQASICQETNISEYLDWRRVQGSGSRPTCVGDVKSSSWLGECKTHVKPNHKIHFDAKIWAKLVEEADSQFKLPAYFSDDGSQKISKTWVVFRPTHSFCEFITVPYPLRAVDSLNFSNDQLLKYMNSYTEPDVVMFFNWGSEELWLTNLVIFRNLIGGP